MCKLKVIFFTNNLQKVVYLAESNTLSKYNIVSQQTVFV